MIIKDQILQAGEYFTAEYPKYTIYVHHTAGSHRPDWVINGWDNDDAIVGTTKTARIVGTPFVIGGISTSNNDSSFDGLVYRACNEKGWIHHLGTKFANNVTLNKNSIGIEICNYGPLTLGKDGNYYNYVSKPVPKDQVVKLDKPFKGFIYYHKYTDKQIESLKQLILYLKQIFLTLSLKTPLTTVEGFELNNNAKNNVPGIYSHTNVRADKYDISPQPNIIKLFQQLNNL